METPSSAVPTDADPKQVSYTQVMYALQLVAVVVGLVSLLSGSRTYLFGLPATVALVMNVARRKAVRGTWLDSHFDWQLRSYTWALFWVVMGTLAFGSFALIITPIPLMEISFVAIAAWFTWRAIRGWRAWREGRAAPPRDIARTA